MVRLLPLALLVLLPPSISFVSVVATPLLYGRADNTTSLTSSTTTARTVSEQTKAAQSVASMAQPVTIHPPSISFSVPTPSLTLSVSSPSPVSSATIPPSVTSSSSSATSSSSTFSSSSSFSASSLTSSSQSEVALTTSTSSSSSSSPSSTARTSSTRTTAALPAITDTSSIPPSSSSTTTTVSRSIPPATFVATHGPAPSATSASSVPPPVSSSTASAQQLSTSGSGFWNNKAAVGGVFAVVGLLIVGALIVLVVSFMKRLNKRRAEKIDKDLFDNTYPESMRPPPSPPAMSLNDPPLDPFAADEVRQVSGAASLGMSGYGHSEEGHGGSSSHGHSSSNYYHGFSGVSLPTTATAPGLPTMYENPFEDRSSNKSSGYNFYMHGQPHTLATAQPGKPPSLGTDHHPPYARVISLPGGSLSAKSSANTFLSTAHSHHTGTSASVYSNQSYPSGTGLSPRSPEAVAGYAL